LIGLDRGDKRVRALLDRALALRRNILVPAGVVGQVWRNGRLQVALTRFLLLDEVAVVPLDHESARAAGELCAASNSTDVIDASVVVLAKARRASIISSDPNDLRRLDPTAQVIPI
jgi:hypothetical protein